VHSYPPHPQAHSLFEINSKQNIKTAFTNYMETEVIAKIHNLHIIKLFFIIPAFIFCFVTSIYYFEWQLATLRKIVEDVEYSRDLFLHAFKSLFFCSMFCS
jgi:hypothetical protein